MNRKKFGVQLSRFDVKLLLQGSRKFYFQSIVGNLQTNECIKIIATVESNLVEKLKLKFSYYLVY